MDQEVGYQVKRVSGLNIEIRSVYSCEFVVLDPSTLLRTYLSRISMFEKQTQFWKGSNGRKVNYNKGIR